MSIFDDAEISHPSEIRDEITVALTNFVWDVNALDFLGGHIAVKTEPRREPVTIRDREVAKMALEVSIGHWQNIVDGNEGSKGADNCALCVKFRKGRENADACSGCPVMEKTGRKNCVDTPYPTFTVYSKTVNGAMFAVGERAVEAAKKELEFLKSLRPLVEGPKFNPHLPTWTADGRRAVFNREDHGAYLPYLFDVEGESWYWFMADGTLNHAETPDLQKRLMLTNECPESARIDWKKPVWTKTGVKCDVIETRWDGGAYARIPGDGDWSYDADGRYCRTDLMTPHARDLTNEAPMVQREGYVNVYKDEEGSFTSAGHMIFPGEETARAYAGQVNLRHVAVGRLTWTEKAT